MAMKDVKHIKKYWHLIFATIMTVVLGVATVVTSMKLAQTKPVAPNVPQVKPKASEPACTLAFSIGSPTGTPTPTPTPTGTGTPTPTPTPTPSSNSVPDCTGLSVSPTSGNASLTVTLTCSGRDSNGDITAADFSFGDGNTRVVEKNVGNSGSLSTTYTYTSTGTFGPSCRVRDNNYVYSNTSDACKKTVTVNGSGTTTTTTTTGTTTTDGTTTTGGGTTTTTTTNPAGTAPTAPPVPKVPVAGAGPSILGVTTIAGGILLLLLGLAL